MIQLFTSLPKNLNIVCEFVKIDHDEDWKISYHQLSGFSQELRTTPFAKCVCYINQPCTAAFLQRNENTAMASAAINSSEARTMRNSKSETLVRFVGANLQTRNNKSNNLIIHVLKKTEYL